MFTAVTIPLVNTDVAVALVPATVQLIPPSDTLPDVCVGAVAPDTPLPAAV